MEYPRSHVKVISTIYHPKHYVVLCVCGRRREAHPVNTPTYHCGKFVPTEEQTRKGPIAVDDY